MDVMAVLLLFSLIMLVFAATAFISIDLVASVTCAEIQSSNGKRNNHSFSLCNKDSVNRYCDVLVL